MSRRNPGVPPMDAERLPELVKRLVDSEVTLESVLARQVDAVIDPETKTPILLRHAQQALRHSEERFRLLVDGVRDHALIMLGPNGSVQGWNLAAERLFGYSENEIVGKHFSCFYMPEERSLGKPDLRLIGKAGGRLKDDARFIRKGESQFWA